MKKIILPTMMLALALTACEQKPAEPVTDSEVAVTDIHDKDHSDDEHAHDEHAHDEHSHDHAGHDHHHHEGDQFQCGDQTVHIVVHEHEGEMEAHLTADDIVYDLNQDDKDKKRFNTNEGIEGNNKPMTLVLDGDKAQILKADNSALLDCTKIHS
ncbi:hypothetical protein LU276_06075 [Moraxella haemolytica]|uniref:hypothetical protein n=1 Tax=Moraxella haemolytica TaxID=2904119 RepID=UPI002543EDC9|nr:hypothetical protein [Moraxella sp. ZY171148]WII94597.1 hypothetical protein LU276_06075 [Moraxella sp. ZY171148]